MMQYRNIILICVLPVICITFSCGGKFSSPAECVNTFILAAMQHDITRAWNTLSPEAQAFYNSIGEKNRKSGKGILEHEISEITKFKVDGSDFNVVSETSTQVKIVTSGEEIIIETIDLGDNHKLKDVNSVRKIIKAITIESVKIDYY